MSDAYNQLLDATIQHLEDLKANGRLHVNVSPENLDALAQVPAPAQTRRKVVPETQPAEPQPSQPTPRVRPFATPASVEPDIMSIPKREIAAPAVASIPLDPVTKAAAFAALRERAMSCHKCPHLAAARKNVVFGIGNINAELMFVGEAPGADEDIAGEPFVGKAGQLLTRIIQTMGLTRDSVYIANVLKCRPDTPGQSTGNRKPTPDEMRTCIGFLQEQIDLIRPKVLVGLGGTAIEGLLGKPAFITRMRGQWLSYRGIPLMPTYHPAYLLRNQAPLEKRRVWEDMLQVMERLGLPISEKLRNYFRSA